MDTDIFRKIIFGHLGKVCTGSMWIATRGRSLLRKKSKTLNIASRSANKTLISDIFSLQFDKLLELVSIVNGPPVASTRTEKNV